MVVRRRFSSRKTRKSGVKRQNKKYSLKQRGGDETDLVRISEVFTDPLMQEIIKFKMWETNKSNEAEFLTELQDNEKLQKQMINMFDGKGCEHLETKIKELQQDQKKKDEEYEDMQGNAVDSEKAHQKEVLQLEEKLASEKKKLATIIVEHKAEIELVKNANTEKNEKINTELHNLKLDFNKKQKDLQSVESLITEQITQNENILEENKIYKEKQPRLEKANEGLSLNLTKSKKELKDEKDNCTALLAEQKKKYEDAGIDLKNLVAEQERYEKEIVKIKAEYEKDKESADELSTALSKLETQNVVLKQQQLNLEDEIKEEYEKKQKVYKQKLIEENAAEKERLTGEINNMKTQSEELMKTLEQQKTQKIKLEEDVKTLTKEEIRLKKVQKDILTELNNQGVVSGLKKLFYGQKSVHPCSALHYNDCERRTDCEIDKPTGNCRSKEETKTGGRRRTHFKKSFKKKFRQLKRKMTKRR